MTSMLLRCADHPGAPAGPRPGEVADPGPLARSADRPPWPGEVGLLALARGLTRNVGLWPEVFAPAERVWHRMVSSDDFEAWVIGWPPGGAIELHDHGDAAGVVVVASGELVQSAVTTGADGAVGTATTVLATGGSVTFGAGHVHDIVNMGVAPAVSVHVYAPRLTAMTFYRIARGRLVRDRTVRCEQGEATP